jgi:NAD+ synthase
MALSKDIANWIKKEVRLACKKGVVLGLSGGVDSAVAGALSKLAMGENVLGLIIPCKSGFQDIEMAREAAKKFDIETKEITLDGIYDELAGTYPEASSLARANLKPRLRMATLYYFANTLDYLVVGTGNKSELAIGYFTKYGDGGVDILPLGGLLKSDVKGLARDLGVPPEIIERPPSAGLWEGQTDEGEIGVTYDELDRIIVAIEKKKTGGIDRKALGKIKKMMADSEHKRCSVPVFSKAGRAGG